MNKLKVMTIVGTRPEIIKLCRVIAEFDKHFEHILVHTGQNYDYELNEIFFSQLDIRKPDYFLDAAGSNPAETMGNVIARSYEVMMKKKPEAILLLGDTNSCLSAISAKRLKIPVFHMEAGNRSFDERVPEEINRRIVDHISDINMPYTEHARRYLTNEGIKPETIIKTGSPMRQVLEYYQTDIKDSKILKELKLEKGKYFVVSAHREENIDSNTNLKDITDSLDEIANKYEMPVIVSTHPRTHKRLQESGGFSGISKEVRFLKPQGFFDYVHLQMNAFCTISDSGTITEESSILNFPAITIRQAHERPEGMDEATVIMSGLKSERVLRAIEIVTDQHNDKERVFNLVEDYKNINVSQKVTRIVTSYIDYVNRTVWGKSQISDSPEKH